MMHIPDDNDGFENLDEDLIRSHNLTEQELFLHANKQAQGRKIKTIKVEMDRYIPSPKPLDQLIKEQALKTGQAALQKFGKIASQIPTILYWGVSGLYNKLNFLNNNIGMEQTNIEQDETKNNPRNKEIDLNEQIIVIIMPEKILKEDIATQNKWMEEQKAKFGDNIQIMTSNQAIPLKNLVNSDLTSSLEQIEKSSKERGFQDEFQRVQNLDEIEAYLMSEKDYQQYLNNQEKNKQIKYEETLYIPAVYQIHKESQFVIDGKSASLKYPRLPPIITKLQFLKEEKEYYQKEKNVQEEIIKQQNEVDNQEAEFELKSIREKKNFEKDELIQNQKQQVFESIYEQQQLELFEQ